MDVLCSGVDFGEDEEDAGHVVAFVGLAVFLLVVSPSLQTFLVLTVYDLPFLFPNARQKGNHDGLSSHRKEG